LCQNGLNITKQRPGRNSDKAGMTNAFVTKMSLYIYIYIYIYILSIYIWLVQFPI